MQNKVYISKANKKVVEFIKQSISNKKEKHQQLIQSIKPSIVDNLQKMQKVEFSQK
jgi:hypothetical protein